MQFHEIAYQIVISEKRANVSVLAKKLGLSTDALYARLRGRNEFRPDEMQQLVRTVPDVRFASWFLSGTKFIPVDRVGTESETIEPGESLRRTALMMLVEASDAADQIEQALADNRIDVNEAAIIKADIETAERAIATLREHVRVMAR